MDKPTLDSIYALAKTLPPTYQTSTRKLAGKELLDMGFTDWEGRKVEEARTYCVPVRVATNHIRLFTRIARDKGMDAVLELVHRMREGKEVKLALQ